jgi:hypothetical protein
VAQTRTLDAIARTTSGRRADNFIKMHGNSGWPEDKAIADRCRAFIEKGEEAEKSYAVRGRANLLPFDKPTSMAWSHNKRSA